jgi:nitrogen fixation-related uncharacterized protein
MMMVVVVVVMVMMVMMSYLWAMRRDRDLGA